MALTVIITLLVAFILSLTFVPAAIAIWLGKRVEEMESRPSPSSGSATSRGSMRRCVARP